MKVARVFSVVFGIVGVVLMLGTAVLCFGSLDAPVRAEVPQAVKDCAAEMAQTLSEGDLTAVEEQLYGNPKLGADRELTGEAAAVWEIFRKGISCELTSEVYVSGSSFAVDASITVPKMESITDSVADHARTLLDERIAAAERMDELYDENGDFHREIVDAVMAKAVELSLAEEPEMLNCAITFGFVCQGTQWYVVPDTALLQALSGGL